MTTCGSPAPKTSQKLAPLTIVLYSFSTNMSIVLEINRDFPYQIELPVDEQAMDVLDWLEGREFQWDNPAARCGVRTGQT